MADLDAYVNEIIDESGILEDSDVDNIDSEETDSGITEDNVEDNSEENIESDTGEEQPVEDSTTPEKAFDYEKGYKELQPEFTRKSQRLKEVDKKIEEYEDAWSRLESNPSELVKLAIERGVDLKKFIEDGKPKSTLPKVDEFETENEKVFYGKLKEFEAENYQIKDKLKQMEDFMYSQKDKDYENYLMDQFESKRKEYNIPEELYYSFQNYMDLGTKSKGSRWTIDDAMKEVAYDIDLIRKDGTVDPVESIKSNKEIYEKFKKEIIDEYLNKRKEVKRKTSSLSMNKATDRLPSKPKKSNELLDITQLIERDREAGKLEY